MIKKAIIMSGVLAVILLANGASGHKATKFDGMSKSVVELTSPSKNLEGTGFITTGKSGKPVLVTNFHVCNSSKDEMLASRMGEIEDLHTHTLVRDSDHDLCIMTPVPGVPLKIGREPPKFSMLYIVGHPRFRPQTPTTGYYTSEREQEMVYPFNLDGSCPPNTEVYRHIFSSGCLLTTVMGDVTATVFPGNSGSPIVNEEGELVGVINSNDGMNYGSFIPVRYLKNLLKDF